MLTGSGTGNSNICQQTVNNLNSQKDPKKKREIKSKIAIPDKVKLDQRELWLT